LVHCYDPKPKRRLFDVLKSQGLQANQDVTFLTDGGEEVRALETISFFEDDVGALEVDYPNLGKLARAVHEFAVYITSNTNHFMLHRAEDLADQLGLLPYR
jgi:hypothetical protein